MTKILYFDISDVPGEQSSIICVDFTGIGNVQQLFTNVGTALDFELVPQNSWDAFLDQFREFCTSRETDTVLLFDGFEKFSKSCFQLSAKLTESIYFAINEHYQIIQHYKGIPEEKRIHDNKDVRIFLVLK